MDYWGMIRYTFSGHPERSEGPRKDTTQFSWYMTIQASIVRSFASLRMTPV
jgi:hypothetical protein